MNSSRAWPGPIARNTYGAIVAGSRPSRTSAANRAPSTAIATSLHATSPAPPPIAWTADPRDHGLRATVHRLERRRHRRGLRTVLVDGQVHAGAHPLQVARPSAVPAPVSTTTRTPSSAPATCRPPTRDRSSPGSSAFRRRAVQGERHDRAVARDDDVGHVRNTPNVVGSSGARDAASSPRASTLRVSSGSITPSSHKRAVEK